MTDTDTGMTSSSAGNIEFGCNNVQQFTMYPNGNNIQTNLGFKGNDNYYAKVSAPSVGMTSSYTMKLPTALPVADSYLKCDASGNLSWVAI